MGPVLAEAEGDTVTAVDDLAVVIHDAQCDSDLPAAQCPRWDRLGHRGYYQEKAAAISAALEPVIGPAGVTLACRVILEEMS